MHLIKSMQGSLIELFSVKEKLLLNYCELR